MQSQLVMTCAVCAREASADAAFCSRCGARLARRDAETVAARAAERSEHLRSGPQRLAAIPAQGHAPSYAEPPVTSLAALLDGLDGAAPDGPEAGGTRSVRERSSRRERRAHDRGAPHVADLADVADVADVVDLRDERDRPQSTDEDFWTPEPAGRAGRRTAVVLALLAVALAAGIVALLVHSLTAKPATVYPTGATASTGGQAGSGSTAGQAQAAAPTGSLDAHATVKAPATSPDSRDGSGHPTSYAAALMLDGDPSTAWRMDGDGKGGTITFTLDRARSISRLGLVNGYAKLDPDSGADRYAQERRITKVTWIVDGTSYPQALTDGDRSVQTLQIAPVTASTVQLRLETTTSPGAAAFDKTAISDVLLGS